MSRIRKLFTFPIDTDLAKALRKVEARDGVSKAEQIRRGLRMWLMKRGAIKPERKGAAGRKRP
jgi:hypothetical protein